MLKQHHALASLPTKRKLLLKRKQPGSDGGTNVHGIKHTYAETVQRHTYTHARTHARTHTLAHAHTRTHTRTRAHTRARTHTHTHTHTARPTYKFTEGYFVSLYKSVVITEGYMLW